MLNDSRYEAFRHYGKRGLGWLFNTSTLAGNVCVSLVVLYFFRKLGHEPAVNFVFFVSVLSVGLWITEAIPPFAVGILIISLFLIGFGTDFFFSREQIPAHLFIGTWSSHVIWLLLGGFFLAEGLREAQLDRLLLAWAVHRFGRQPRSLLAGLLGVAAFGSMFMSNTATTAMMVSSVLPLVLRLGRDHPFTKALLVGIPAAASLGGLGTIIGSTPNAIAVGALHEKGISISFITWMLVGLPLALLLVFIFYQLLVARFRLRAVTLPEGYPDTPSGSPDRFKQRAVAITLLLTVSSWLTEPWHQIPVAGTCVIPILGLTVTQVLTAAHVRTLPWDTLMLVAGGLALGIAIVEVGLARIVMERVNEWPLPNALLALCFCFLAVAVSNVMSNTAAAAILVPLAIGLPGLYGITVPVMVAISCSCALALPVSTPSNAVAYATGLLAPRDFRPGGLWMALFAPLLALGASLLWGWLSF